MRSLTKRNHLKIQNKNSGAEDYNKVNEKNAIESINIRMGQAKESTCELDDRKLWNYPEDKEKNNEKEWENPI